MVLARKQRVVVQGSSYEGIKWIKKDVEKEGDLGIIVSDNLTYMEHMNGKISKTNRAMGFIRRILVIFRGPPRAIYCYQTEVTK